MIGAGDELQPAHAFSPGGLYSGGVREQDYPFIGYLGHVFCKLDKTIMPKIESDTAAWCAGDQEFFMWPPILPLFPRMSKAALLYRTDPQRLAAAEAIAKNLGAAGAKYPLESAATGAEQMWTSAKYGWEELEESGCVAWALEQQFWQSRDQTWLRTAAPAILKIAQFFASRVVRCETPLNTSLYCLDHVMGPDESHAPVNNSGFTSGIAAASIASGIRVARLVGAPVPSNWSVISQNIFLPFDEVARYHPEYLFHSIGHLVNCISPFVLVMCRYVLFGTGMKDSNVALSCDRPTSSSCNTHCSSGSPRMWHPTI